ncbi:MAG: hypothetical protein WBE58_15720 [Verrucomicrobiales bacterium]|nr:hypothetical protein [Verrucomicrobiales bacterium]
MTPSIFPTPAAVIGLVCCLAAGLAGRALVAQEIPEDLIEDEHLREEYGVNQFTTPSIRKIFDDLQKLRPLPYDKLKREPSKSTPKDRTKLAIALGGLIADGFCAVEAEKLGDLETVARALKKHAEILGAGSRLSKHAKSLFEHSALSDWSGLKTELAKTQMDVEAEMLLLRDVEVAHLIALGGWMRAFEIACTAALEDFKPEKAQVLARRDLVEYFLMTLETLEPQVQELKHIKAIHAGMSDLFTMLDLPDGKQFTKEEVEAMRLKIREIQRNAFPAGKPEQSSDPPTGSSAPAVSSAATPVAKAPPAGSPVP